MTLEGEQQRDYSKMSSDELTKELGTLFGYAPSTLETNFPNFRGLNKEFTEMLCQRLDRILQRSQLSQSLRKLVIMDFEFRARLGFDNPKVKRLVSNSIDNIFDPNTAQNPIRSLIRSFSERATKAADLLNDIRDEGVA